MDEMEKIKLLIWIHLHIFRNVVCIYMIYLASHMVYGARRHRQISCIRRWSLIEKMPDQIKKISKLIELNDQSCIDNLRMDRNAFFRLCYLLENLGGMRNERFVTVTEKVACFLLILAHHTKNRIVKHNFKRSGQTISKYFAQTLKAIIKISSLLLVEPHPVDDDCTSEPWKHFKGCLGALDGTNIEVRVHPTEKPRYRSRKGFTTVNVLGVCNHDMNFVYLLAGWEGSAADGRVLQDALRRPHGLRVPNGCYYLCDAGYMNCDGFLTPYRGTRYHLEEWRTSQSTPNNPQELFNLQHAKARNVIERAFGVLKGRWAIIRSPSFYSIKFQNRIILVCALLHNFIRMQMDYDPFEAKIVNTADGNDLTQIENIDIVESSTAWNNWRDELAANMFNQWMGSAQH